MFLSQKPYVECIVATESCGWSGSAGNWHAARDVTTWHTVVKD